MGMVGKETLSGGMCPPSLKSGNRTSLRVSISQTVTLGRVPGIPQAAHLTRRETRGLWFSARRWFWSAYSPTSQALSGHHCGLQACEAGPGNAGSIAWTYSFSSAGAQRSNFALPPGTEGFLCPSFSFCVIPPFSHTISWLPTLCCIQIP